VASGLVLLLEKHLERVRRLSRCGGRAGCCSHAHACTCTCMRVGAAQECEIFVRGQGLVGTPGWYSHLFLVLLGSPSKSVLDSLDPSLELIVLDLAERGIARVGVAFTDS
jgi:hypothetical protein